MVILSTLETRDAAGRSRCCKGIEVLQVLEVLEADQGLLQGT